MISLEQLLESRERRVQHQKEMLQAFPGCSLICLTVQLPGPVKRNRESLIIGGAGLGALLNVFGSVLRHVHVRDLETGYEAYMLVPLPALELKKRCCKIEDTHPLGRLMDIDVLGAVMPGPDRASETPDQVGGDFALLGRADVGLEPRRCLLCSNEARYCMRAKTHTREELLEKISQMVLAYSE